MPKFKPIITSSSKLDSINIKPGQFIIDSSMSKLYFDTPDTRRLEFGVNAQSAISDRLGQQIDTTYIKNISITDYTLTVTNGGGTTTLPLPKCTNASTVNGKYITPDVCLDRNLDGYERLARTLYVPSQPTVFLGWAPPSYLVLCLYPYNSS